MFVTNRIIKNKRKQKAEINEKEKIGDLALLEFFASHRFDNARNFAVPSFHDSCGYACATDRRIPGEKCRKIVLRFYINVPRTRQESFNRSPTQPS